MADKKTDVAETTDIAFPIRKSKNAKKGLGMKMLKTLRTCILCDAYAPLASEVITAKTQFPLVVAMLVLSYTHMKDMPLGHVQLHKTRRRYDMLCTSCFEQTLDRALTTGTNYVECPRCECHRIVRITEMNPPILL